MSQWFHASSKKGLQDLELKQETSGYIRNTILCEIYPAYNLVDNSPYFVNNLKNTEEKI